MLSLLLLGLATLIVGIANDSLRWVFAAVGSTVVALVVLYVNQFRPRRTSLTVEAAAEPSAPAATDDLPGA